MNLFRKDLCVNIIMFKDNYASASVKNNQVYPEIQESKTLLPVERTSIASTHKEPVDYYMTETTISRGKEVSLDEHMSDRRFTVFYFYADWSPGCREVSPRLREKNKKSYLFALRKINIYNWRTPVVKQYSIHRIPYCIVYDTDGKKILSSSDACRIIAERPEMLERL